jgi:hypothetical protein
MNVGGHKSGLICINDSPNTWALCCVEPTELVVGDSIASCLDCACDGGP